MNRAELQALALYRLEDAKTLLANGRADGAYYIAGYAVECALKACIAKNTGQFDFPPKPDLVRDIYTDNLGRLLKIAGLELPLRQAAPPGSSLDKNWAKVLLWSEESRYVTHAPQDATDLYDAIADPAAGVLAWLQQNW